MKNFQELLKQKLSKEELKSINAGGPNCIPYPPCTDEEVVSYVINSCGWYIYRTVSNSVCMTYGAS